MPSLKKSALPVAVILMVIVAAGFGWWFFTRAGLSTLTEDQRIVLSTQDTRLTRGSEDAPVKIVEYVDLLCPFCAQAEQDTVPKIMEKYVETGKVQYEVRVIAKTAPDSQRAGEGAYCAAEQDLFWKYLDAAYDETWRDYYSRNKDPSEVPIFQEARIGSFASSVGLNVPEWQACVDEGTYAETIAENETELSELDAFGTPHFVINNKNYNGAPPYPAFEAVIETQLKEAKRDKSSS